MWNFQRIICMWICCVSCMFGTTQLSSSLVLAVPYEYFDDHEQSFYDLDSEQIQAKYDTRLLAQQMLQTEQQQQQHLENLKGFHTPRSGGSVEKPSSFISTATTKLKSNDGRMLGVGAFLGDDWLEETATKAAALTTTITETLDELHLPRAASCFTNGQKFTHGQKVPRLDNCEVCLCMDGEIFCWWEKCDKKPTKAATAYDDYSTPFEESSTTRMQLNPKTTYKTTLKPMKKPKTNEDYKYDDDDSAELREMQQEYENIKEQLMQKENEPEQHEIHHNKQIAKKKTYLQQQVEGKRNKKIKEQNKNKNNKQQEEQQQSYKPHKINEQHHHAHNHNNNRNNNHDYGSNGSSSKILNFPENLPSVLYYDYKTEEHHQHQHQHHEQHLKHQKQKQQQKLLLQQHEKELKHQQQQKQQQQNHVNRHHEYGQNVNTYSSISSTLSKVTGTGREEGPGEAVKKGTTGSEAGDASKLHSRIGDSSTIFKYFSNGNENIYSEDLQTDSDILPEPPTNKPKFLTSITDTMPTANTTRLPISQLYRLSTSMMATTAGTTTRAVTTTGELTNAHPTDSLPLKKQIFSPWDYNKPNRYKINNNDNNGNGNTNSNDNRKNNESSEDTIETDDQDDAFHRWLTSTETNNKNNFTLNDAIIGIDDDEGLDVAAVGGSGLDASNNDYNVDERNYENINWETEKELSTINSKTKTTIRPITTKGAAAEAAAATTTTALNEFNIVKGGAGAGGEAAAIYYENIQTPKYEEKFSENNSFNNSSNNMPSSNVIINRKSQSDNNENSSPFSSSYQNFNGNSIKMEKPTSSSAGVASSTTSNEENGIASVVNIDIMLTASSADSQKQLQTNIETTNQHQQLQQQDFENEKQIVKTQLKFMQPQVLISNTNDVNNNNPLYSIINNNTRNLNSSNNNYNKNITNIVGDDINIKERTQQQNVGVNLSNSNSNFNNTSASSQSLSSSSDSFKLNHISAVVSQTNATSAVVTPPPHSTTLSPERQCNVMGTLYKIGDVLPQDTGNCLQCICIDGSTSDDTPRVTCSPHNCPPLVLPDLFDATGY